MHDCPKCKVPLHGYERVCPSCGTPQKVSKGSSRLFGDEIKKPPTNPMPIIISVVVLIGLIFVIAQTSWLGQLLTKGPTKADPLAKMTFQEARTLIDTKLQEGFTAAAATKAEVKWQRDGKDVDKLSPGPVQVEVNAELASPDQHKAIVEPIKDFMDKAQITSLVFNDTKDPKTKRNWTYSVQAAAPAADGADPSAAAPAAAPAAATGQ